MDNEQELKSQEVTFDMVSIWPLIIFQVVVSIYV